jgi:serine/threonine protein phosphatase PrpC
VLLGSAHQLHGAIGVSSLGGTLAVATSAGAVAKAAAPLEPNEDAGAVVRGPRADLLVVADAHHGALASQIAVEGIAAAVGDDPPPADLPDHALEAMVYEVGLAIRDNTSLGQTARPSRTTLAFALVTPDAVQWASFGDSVVFVGDATGVAELASRRSAYLGHGFVRAEMAAFLDRGRRSRSDSEYVMLATDGLWSLGEARLESLVVDVLGRGDDAAGSARGIVSAALAAGVDDAVTVAIASPAQVQ